MNCFCLRRVHVRWLARVGLEFRLQDSIRQASMSFRDGVHNYIWAYGYDNHCDLKNLLPRRLRAASNARINPRINAEIERRRILHIILSSECVVSFVWTLGTLYPLGLFHRGDSESNYSGRMLDCAL